MFETGTLSVFVSLLHMFCVELTLVFRKYNLIANN